MTRTRRQTVAVALAAVLLLGAAGCGGDDSERAQGDPTAAPSTDSATTDPATTDPGSTGPSTTESTSPAPSVTPATGLELVEASSTVHAPAGWQAMDPLLDYASGAIAPDQRSSMQLVDSGDISGGASLDTQAASAIKTLPKGAQAERLPDVMLDGVAAFHIHYTVPGDRQEYDTITTVRRGRNVGLDFFLLQKNTATNPDLIASVLATFTWTA